MARAPHYRTLASLSRISLLREVQERGPLTMSELTAATGLHQNTVREHLARLERAGFIASDEGAPAGRGRPKLTYRTRLDADDLARAERLRALAGQASTAEGPASVAEGRAAACSDEGGAGRPRDALDAQLAALVDHLDGCGIEADTEKIGASETTSGPGAAGSAEMAGSPGAAGSPGTIGDSGATGDQHAIGEAGSVRRTGEHHAAVELHECPYAELASDHPQVCQAHFGLVKEVLRQAEGPLEAEALDPLEGPNRCTLHLRRRA